MNDRAREYDASEDGRADVPFRVRLPGFVADEAVGLGDVVGRVGRAFGVAPCGGCRARSEWLNRRVVFTR
jgi:hypothetical protein